MKVLITGGAGFIGATLAHHLLDHGNTVTAIDNLNDYYEVSLKEARLATLDRKENFTFLKLDIADRDQIKKLFQTTEFDVIVNLAAQAGVRYSLENPAAYIDANMVGFGNILEGCRNSKSSHLVFASSSSIYGGSTQFPFSEKHAVDHPVSLYGASKKANELMAHTYAHLYGLPCTGLRFFTVYGPWGRPDMAFFKFTRLMLNGEKIPVYNDGNLTRDFTYIDDIVEGIVRVIDNPAERNDKFDHSNPSPESSTAPYRIYNIGNGSRVNLMDYIHALEDALGVKGDYEMMPMQPGDVEATNADMSLMNQKFDFQPKTNIAKGLNNFVAWYRNYYHA